MTQPEGPEMSTVEARTAAERQVKELHELLMGGVKDGKRVGSIIDALHRLDTHLAVIALNSELVLEKHRDYVNEVARVHQENIMLKQKFAELRVDVARLQSALGDASGSKNSG